MNEYAKPHLTFVEQSALVRSRGLTITNKAEFEHALRTIGYYRLSAYWYPFRQYDPVGTRADTFAPGTSSNQILRLYEFDRRLKLLVLNAIERIEIAVRVAVGHTAGRSHAYAHLEPSCLDGKFTRIGRNSTESPYAAWINKYCETQKRAQEMFVAHFEQRYDGRLPLWVATEIMEFGQLSRLYSGLRYNDRMEIAVEFGITDPDVFSSWLRTLVYVRNVCAHHARLWNRNMSLQARLPKEGEVPQLDHLSDDTHAQARVCLDLAILVFLMEANEPTGMWARKMLRHLESFGNIPALKYDDMGFPDGWKQQQLWQRQME